jgi:hypothetical protein
MAASGDATSFIASHKHCRYLFLKVELKRIGNCPCVCTMRGSPSKITERAIECKALLHPVGFTALARYGCIVTSQDEPSMANKQRICQNPFSYHCSESESLQKHPRDPELDPGLNSTRARSSILKAGQFCSSVCQAHVTLVATSEFFCKTFWDSKHLQKQ